MSEREAKKLESGHERRARLAAQEDLEEGLQGASSGMERINDRLARLDPLGSVSSPGLQGAQRSRYVTGLQQSHGNRYVQRAIEGQAACPAGSPLVHIAPRPETSGTIARDLAPEARTRLLREFSTTFRNVEAIIIRVQELLARPRPQYDAMRRMLALAGGPVVDFLRRYEQWDIIALRAQELAGQIETASLAVEPAPGGSVEEARTLLSVAEQSAAELVQSGSVRRRALALWERRVTRPLAEAQELISGRRPDFSEAGRLCGEIVAFIGGNRGRWRTDDPDLPRLVNVLRVRLQVASTALTLLSAPEDVQAEATFQVGQAAGTASLLRELIAEEGVAPAPPRPVVFTRGGSRPATPEEIAEAEAEAPVEWRPVEPTTPPAEAEELPGETGPVVFTREGSRPATEEELAEW